ncbi:MFS transporter [Plantactinospora sp. KBS50]|uniref:MFS transporter n=1 Tax=Plantactinospora sp. KBS50 TaxID=2024580 RepID=UPI0012FE49E3|nr:MFS transporter [Plantactinospora sp. KBS50]
MASTVGDPRLGPSAAGPSAAGPVADPADPDRPAHPADPADAGHPADPGQPAPAWRPWAVLAVVSVAQVMVLLDATVVNVALPRLQAGLHVTPAQLPWVLDAYTVTFGGLLLLGGRAADLLGRRRVFLGGLLVFTAASLACGLAARPAELIVARAGQGIGAGFLSPAALSIVTATFPRGPRRHTALGIWGGLGGLGATAGVVLGGLVVGTLGWPWVFLINLPPGVLAGGLALVLVPRLRRAPTGDRRRGADVPGALVVTAGLLLLIYATISLPETGLPPLVVPGCAGTAVLLLALFVRIERRSAAPMVPGSALRDRGLVVGSVGQFLVGATQLSVMFLISMQAQRRLMLDPLRGGLSFVPMGVVAIGSALLTPG